MSTFCVPPSIKRNQGGLLTTTTTTTTYENHKSCTCAARMFAKFYPEESLPSVRPCMCVCVSILDACIAVACSCRCVSALLPCLHECTCVCIRCRRVLTSPTSCVSSTHTCKHHITHTHTHTHSNVCMCYMTRPIAFARRRWWRFTTLRKCLQINFCFSEIVRLRLILLFTWAGPDFSSYFPCTHIRRQIYTQTWRVCGAHR